MLLGAILQAQDIAKKEAIKARRLCLTRAGDPMPEFQRRRGTGSGRAPCSFMAAMIKENRVQDHRVIQP